MLDECHSSYNVRRCHTPNSHLREEDIQKMELTLMQPGSVAALHPVGLMCLVEV